MAELTGPQEGVPDVAVTLTAASSSFRLATGEQVDGYTLNGTSPGPEISATQGDLVEVTLLNENGHRRARRCTGTASTCPTPRTASPA